MIPYARQSIDQSDIASVEEVLRADFLTQGPLVPGFEGALAQRGGAKHAVAVNSATAALHLACLALGVGPGDLVWTSPNSFVASANCARMCGADVDFVDVDERTYTMSAQRLEEKLAAAKRSGRLPKAVVTVDFAGQPCAYDEMLRLRDSYGFALIEDASHAVGAMYRERPVGSLGADVTAFSFHPVKIITTGEGGMALTDRADLARRMALLRSHGITRDPAQMRGAHREPWEYEQLALGFNYRMTEIAAALGLSQLKRLDAFLERRRAIAARYDRELADLPLTLPYQHPDAQSSLHLYPVRVRADARLTRAELYDALRERGVAANVHYMPIHLQPYYRALGFAEGDFPQAEAYYRETLSLPLYPDLSDEEQSRVIEALHGALREKTRA